MPPIEHHSSGTALVSPRRRAPRGAALLIVVGLASLTLQTPAKQASPAAERTRATAAGSPAIDVLMGKGGRAEHAKRLAALRIDGATYSWERYAGWGRELFHQGRVLSPPTGPKPSRPLSEFYKCSHCHNHEREDVRLTEQIPEDRFALVRQRAAAGAAPLLMAPGTTLWGAVNREAFYNDSYEAYQALEVPGGREMNPKSLEDATQVCCRYCSVGRYAEPWEIASLLTYFWELELKLSDLQLPAAVEQAVVDVLMNEASSRSAVDEMRRFLSRQYLRRAGDTYTHPPAETAVGTAGPYPDKLTFVGDKQIGEPLYQAACAQCHGADKPNELEGATLIRDLKRFHGILAKGTSRDDEPYMPMFTAQRLSRQQIADIQAYLQSLEGGGCSTAAPSNVVAPARSSR